MKLADNREINELFKTIPQYQITLETFSITITKNQIKDQNFYPINDGYKLVGIAGFCSFNRQVVFLDCYVPNETTGRLFCAFKNNSDVQDFTDLRIDINCIWMKLE